MVGPGKHDKYAEQILQEVAPNIGVIVLVLDVPAADGSKAGVSLKLAEHVVLDPRGPHKIAKILRVIAEQIESEGFFATVKQH